MSSLFGFVSFREWASTRYSLQLKGFVLEVGPNHTYFSNDAFHRRYPGFVEAFDKLTSIGCDAQQATELLKFCLLQEPAAAIFVTLERPGVLQVVKAAVDLALPTSLLIDTLHSLGRADANTLALPLDLSSGTSC